MVKPADSEAPAAYTTERLSGETLWHLVTIARSAFGVELDLHVLQQKYATKEQGAAYVGYIAFDEHHEPAAYYGVFPLKMQVNGQVFLVAQSGDTMTHTAHQGKGLFVRLATETYELAKQEQILFVFGFPNANSYPGFVRKLGWTHPADLQRFSKTTHTIPLAVLAAKNKLADRCYRFLLKRRFGKRAFFESSILASGQDGVYRDRAFWEYKAYGSNFTFEAAGVKVWAKVDGFLLVGDIEYKPSVDYARVMRKIAARARLWGCYKVIFQCSSDSWLASVIPADYISSPGLPVGLKDLSGSVSLENARFTMADFDTF